MSIYFGADNTVLHSGDVGGGKILQVKRTERTAVRAMAHNGSSWSEALESQFRVSITPTASGNTLLAFSQLPYAAGHGTIGGMVLVHHDTVTNANTAMAGYCPSGGSYGAPSNVLSNNSWFYEDLRNNAGNTQWFTCWKHGVFQVSNTNTASIRLFSRNTSGGFNFGDNQQAAAIIVLEIEGSV